MLDYRKVYRVDVQDKRKRIESFTEIAVKAEIVKDGLRKQLGYHNLVRGHLLDGRATRNLKDGLVFYADKLGWTFTLHELTMADFDTMVRPNLPPELSQHLLDLDDVYVWYRKQAGIV